MVVIAEMNVLAVGMEDRAEQFKGLPVRLLNLTCGGDAIRAFKTNQIDSVICHWHLSDMQNGAFLKKLKALKPDIPTVAIIEPDNPQQEIEARRLGVTAVVPEDCDGHFFRQVVASLFGVSDHEAVITCREVRSI